MAVTLQHTTDAIFSIRLTPYIYTLDTGRTGTTFEQVILHIQTITMFTRTLQVMSSAANN